MMELRDGDASFQVNPISRAFFEFVLSICFQQSLTTMLPHHVPQENASLPLQYTCSITYLPTQHCTTYPQNLPLWKVSLMFSTSFLKYQHILVLSESESKSSSDDNCFSFTRCFLKLVAAALYDFDKLSFGGIFFFVTLYCLQILIQKNGCLEELRYHHHYQRRHRFRMSRPLVPSKLQAGISISGFFTSTRQSFSPQLLLWTHLHECTS